MLAGGRSRQTITGLAALAALLVPAAACGSDPDAQPPVASVDFEPRLVVTVDGDGITAATGPREGADRPADQYDDPGQWRTPVGSVVEIVNDADDERRLVVTSSSLGDTEGDPDPWLDTGDLEPGETVVLGLSETGAYRFALDGGEPQLTVLVVPRTPA